jgi:hypothetical protein
MVKYIIINSCGIKVILSTRAPVAYKIFIGGGFGTI